MKNIGILLLALFLGGCASFGVKSACKVSALQSVSFFAEGQNLAAFRFNAAARGYAAGGILQIKKAADGVYDVTAFSEAGAFKLLSARVTAQQTDFNYVLPLVDKPLVRGKLETFLKVLLFAPQSLEKCRMQQDTLWVETTDGRYEYPSGGTYPLSFTQKKLLGSVKLSYGQYTPYEVGQLPHYLFYEDGAIEAEMVLISLKK